MISNLVPMTFAYVNERRKLVRERGSFVGVLSANFRNEIDIREELCYDSRPENAKNSERGKTVAGKAFSIPHSHRGRHS